MLEIFIPLILILAGFSMSKIQFIFASEPVKLSPDLYGTDSERILINKHVANPPSDVDLEERDPSIMPHPDDTTYIKEEDRLPGENIWDNRF